MGNTIFIRNKRVCVRPLRSQIEAFQKLEPPTMIKGYRSFAGTVNFVSLFCPELQKLLKPIHDLTRKGRQFLWGKEQQQAFDEIKRRLQRPPVLHVPDRHGHFQLYSDSSKIATGSALYQVQRTTKTYSLWQEKNARSCKQLFHHRIRNVWTSNEHRYIFAFIKES